MMSRGVTRRSRRRKQPSQRVAVSSTVSRMPAIRSALVVTAVLSIATGTYFAFSDDLTRLISRPTEVRVPYEDQIAKLRAQIDRMSGQFLDQKQAEQQLTAQLGAQVDRIGQLEQHASALEQHASALTDLFTTGTIKLERIAPPEATPPEKSTPASTTNDTVNFVALSDRKAHLQSRELPTRATKKHHRIHRAAHQHASLRHRVGRPKRIALPEAYPAEKRLQSSQLISATTKPYASITDQ
jgi:TolA-binding protein